MISLSENETFSDASGTYQYPIVTHLSVAGLAAISHEQAGINNPGADLQMAARSLAGNDYNPTQGGNAASANGQCKTTTSPWLAQLHPWSGVAGISGNYGALYGVKPLLFTPCGATTPPGYEFNWGITLGDGNVLPAQVAVLDQSIKMPSGSTPLVKSLSEMPAAFFNTNNFPYAWSSTDGVTFKAFIPPGKLTNDARQWTVNELAPFDGQALVLSTTATWLTLPTQGTAVGIYAHKKIRFNISLRSALTPKNLTLISALGGTYGDLTALPPCNCWAYTWRRLLVVGNLNTVKSAISQTKTKLGATWGSGE